MKCLAVRFSDRLLNAVAFPFDFEIANLRKGPGIFSQDTRGMTGWLWKSCRAPSKWAVVLAGVGCRVEGEPISFCYSGR
jgi:hypothetical protein